MEKCFKCRLPETRVLLFDAVLPDGVAKICGKCSSGENIPIIKEPISPNEEQKPLRERLAKISGIKPESEKRTPIAPEKRDELRDLVNANYVFKENTELKEDLIDNFHWVVMRARRMRHITHEQLAGKIHEPEEAVKKIESGFAPAKAETIRKIEKALGIIIRKKVGEGSREKEISEEKFDVVNFEHMTIADLNKMKRDKELEMLEEEIEILNTERDEEDFRY